MSKTIPKVRFPKVRFESKEHEQFYYEMLKKSGINDSYHRSFLLYGDFRNCQD